MFPIPRNRFLRYGPIPHSRGDVPANHLKALTGKSNSPLTWGCSGTTGFGGITGYQFPTHVGMFLSAQTNVNSYAPIPHSRGDVPLFASSTACRTPNSPLTWGCSCGHSCHSSWSLAIPHSRGDVPYDQSSDSRYDTNSPLTWGCSPLDICRHGHHLQFPTHVGMFL